MNARRYDEAIQQYHKALELDPNFPTTYYFLGRAYEAKGMNDQAVAAFTKSQALNGVPPDALQKMNQVSSVCDRNFLCATRPAG